MCCVYLSISYLLFIHCETGLEPQEQQNKSGQKHSKHTSLRYHNPLQRSNFLVRFGPWSFAQVCSRCKFSHLALKILLLFRCSVQPICQPFKKPQKLAHDRHLGSACNFCSKQTSNSQPRKKIDKAVVWATWTHWIHVAAFGCGEFGRKRRGRIQVLATGTCNKIITTTDFTVEKESRRCFPAGCSGHSFAGCCFPLTSVAFRCKCQLQGGHVRMHDCPNEPQKFTLYVIIIQHASLLRGNSHFKW